MSYKEDIGKVLKRFRQEEHNLQEKITTAEEVRDIAKELDSVGAVTVEVSEAPEESSMGTGFLFRIEAQVSLREELPEELFKSADGTVSVEWSEEDRLYHAKGLIRAVV